MTTVCGGPASAIFMRPKRCFFSLPHRPPRGQEHFPGALSETANRDQNASPLAAAMRARRHHVARLYWWPTVSRGEFSQQELFCLRPWQRHCGRSVGHRPCGSECGVIAPVCFGPRCQSKQNRKVLRSIVISHCSARMIVPLNPAFLLVALLLGSSLPAGHGRGSVIRAMRFRIPAYAMSAIC